MSFGQVVKLHPSNHLCCDVVPTQYLWLDLLSVINFLLLSLVQCFTLRIIAPVPFLLRQLPV